MIVYWFAEELAERIDGAELDANESELDKRERKCRESFIDKAVSTLLAYGSEFDDVADTSAL